jgi:predicted TIM-barrel fold metal-dependent hydrolase
MKALPLLVFYLAGVASPVPAADQERIIDMHLHTGLPPKDIPPGTPALCRPAPCHGEGAATAGADETLEKTLEQMDRHNIVKGVVSGMNFDTLRKWSAAAPGRFILSPFILKPGQPSVESIRGDIAAGQFGGVGEIAAQLVGVPANDPRLEPYFSLAEELDVPVLIHSEGIGPYVPGFRAAAGTPLLLEDVLVRHPKLRLYVENAGYPYRDDMIAMMYQYPQLYADVSTITWVIPRTAFYDYLEALVRAGLGKRLMYGSDQMRWPEKIGEGIEAIKQAPFLSEEQKRDILYNNAARFLRLDESPEAQQGSPGAG